MKSERPYVMTARARTTEETGERIVESALALFAELPYAQLTLRAVAERAGVTVQTVIRRYGDKEALAAVAAESYHVRVARQRDAAPSGDVGAAVDNLLGHYEDAGRLALRVLYEEDAVPQLAQLAERGRAYHREWCARVFGPYLAALRGADRARRLAQIVTVCDVLTWKQLRLDAGLSQRQVGVALLELLQPLTTGSSAGNGARAPLATAKGL